jgi:hypothetical protein
MGDCARCRVHQAVECMECIHALTDTRVREVVLDIKAESRRAGIEEAARFVRTDVKRVMTGVEFLAEAVAKMLDEYASAALLGKRCICHPTTVTPDYAIGCPVHDSNKQGEPATCPACSKCKDRGIRDMGKVRCECPAAAPEPTEVCGACGGRIFEGSPGERACVACGRVGKAG